MLRFLQKSKEKKGFTIVELIVVIAIIAVLTAVILPMMSSEKSAINEARSTAADFYAAVQTIMSKYSFYDGPLSPAYSAKDETAHPGIMRHYAKMGGNYPYDKEAGITNHEYPAATSLYIELIAKNGKIESVGAVSRAKNNSSSDAGFFKLLQRSDSDRNTEFGRLFTSEINDRVSFRDGFYYARVDFIPPINPDGTINTAEVNAETVKVAFAAYTKKELPKAAVGSNAAAFENANLYFGSDFKLNCDMVCGTCAPFQGSTGSFPGKYVGLKGTKLN